MANEVTTFDSLIAPAAIVRALESKTLDELVATFRRSETAGLRAWMLASICVGIALERARHGERASALLSESFGCSERTIHRLGQIYETLLKLRIETEGPGAQFVLGAAAVLHHLDRSGGRGGQGTDRAPQAG